MLAQPQRHQPLELWGGIECTVNRVQDQFFDQMATSKHSQRPTDIEMIAAIGIKTLRYPALWEWAAPKERGNYCWSWADERLPRLQKAGIRPIVGLVHHGSGPFYTDLLDPAFETGLAEYAGRLAERFPWVDMYTPVNEPLTTARFSGLYGHWHPHRKDPHSFVTAFLNQCRAVVLSMAAIRRVRPDARLVQTEDLGKTHGTHALRDQVDFENERRWLTFDLLAGRVDHQHPLAKYFRFCGIAKTDWTWFLDHPCPPDVIGINHYLTSERFLDERVDRYPAHCRGGNGRQTYADVEAVRVGLLAGPEHLLREAWKRYRIPMVITEAHLGCTREEQMRWVLEVWRAAEKARRSGADVRAVTLWALLGSYDWDSLVTQARGHYEPGAFDLRASEPRITALGGMAKTLAAGKEPNHPVLRDPGWWQRPQRLIYGDTESVKYARQKRQKTSLPLLIVGSDDPLTSAFVRMCDIRGLRYRCVTRENFDLTSIDTVCELLEECKPWSVILSGGYSRIDQAESDRIQCFRENVTVPTVFADVCADKNRTLLTFSSDLVFDGSTRSPYRESDGTYPISVYGHSKLEAERRVLGQHSRSLVIRTGVLFSPWDDRNFLATTRRSLQEESHFAAADDIYISPTYVPDLVGSSLDLLIDGEQGIWHLANPGELSWVELARVVARRTSHDEGKVEGRPAKSFCWAAPRPAYSALGSERALLLPSLEHALDRFFNESCRC